MTKIVFVSDDKNTQEFLEQMRKLPKLPKDPWEYVEDEEWENEKYG